jgi:hypothetical protein
MLLKYHSMTASTRAKDDFSIEASFKDLPWFVFSIIVTYMLSAWRKSA